MKGKYMVTPARRKAFKRMVEGRAKYWADVKSGKIKPTAKQKRAWKERGQALTMLSRKKSTSHKPHTAKWKNQLKGCGELRTPSIDNLQEIGCKVCGRELGITLKSKVFPGIICTECNQKLILEASTGVLSAVLLRKRVGK